MGEQEKPPLGISPKYLFDEAVAKIVKKYEQEYEILRRNRMREIINAAKGYAKVGRPIPLDWWEEFEELVYAISATNN